MKKQLFTKMLLVALCLIGGSSFTWGDDVASYNFNNQTTPFTISDANRMQVSYLEHVSEGGDYYAKYSCQNMNAVSFAYYNFGNNVADAETVTFEFDYYITQVAGHVIISIADANYHTATNGGFSGKSNTGYGSNGTIFNFGCWRANNNNRFAINGSQKNEEVTAKCLGAWCHASITVNNATQKVSYIIKNADQTVTYLQETNVAFLNASAQRCSQIDIYIGTNADGNAVQIDNLVITKTVSETSHNYTINAVTGNTTLSEIATGAASEGAIYTAYIPKAVQNGGKYYILDDASNTNISEYLASYSMRNANAVKEVNYTLDEDVVFFGEAESIGANGSLTNNKSALSNGSGRHLQASSGYVRLTYSVPNAGIYDMKVGMYNYND